MAYMPLCRWLELFWGEGSIWKVYEEQARVLVWGNDTPEVTERNIFLARCGTRVFGLLLDLLNPATTHDKTLDGLFTALRS